jgi:quercetin dioxygenase-like cupin family protein
MTEGDWKQKLEREGFNEIEVVSFPGDAEFPAHTHEKMTAHVVLEGDLTITDPTGTRVVKSGDRFDVSAGTTHTAKCGPEGCTFIMGEK